MNYENGGTHINYATVTVSVKDGEDSYTCDFYISRDGVTITAPEDDRMKKQVTDVLACAYTTEK